MKHLLAFLSLLTVSACAVTSTPRTALNFPQAQDVRSVCIVAVTTNPGPTTSERGVLGSVNDAAFVQGMAKNKTVMEKISAQAYDDYLASLTRWGEWTVVDIRKASQPANLVAEKRSRQQFADQHQKMFGFNTFVSHTDLIPFKFHPTAEMRQQELADLGRYAKLCNADAAIAVHLDVGYETSTGFGIGGFNLGGTAKAVVNHDILIADRTGREIASTSESTESDQTVAMVSGSVVMDDKFTSIVASTTDKATTRFINRFSAELKNPPAGT